MIAGILMGLLKANLAAAAAVALVIALRKAVRGRLGARAAYVLWLAPLAAAVAVLLPHPAANVAAPPTLAPAVAEAETVTDEFVAAATPASGPDVPALLLAAWMVGALTAAGLLARRQARFVASLGRLEPLSEPGLFRAERAGVGPAVVGVLRPKVVAPADFETRYAPGERDLILAHERAHLRAHDALANAAVCAVQCLCWFNPLVHLAARLARVDQELACDATVIGRFPDARRTYAELLLKTQLFTQPLPLGCHWPAGAEHPLKARIAMLKSPLPARAARRLGAVTAFAACAAAAGLAWASQPAPNAPPTTATAADLAAIPNNGHLEPEEARKLWRPGLAFLCKPDENHELHNCTILHGSPWAKIATAADIVREWPPQARRIGLTAEVLVKCDLDQTTMRLVDCGLVGAPDTRGKPLSAEMRKAFEQAAVRVTAYYQALPKPPGGDRPIPSPNYMDFVFEEHPVVPGGKPANQAPTHAPAGIPVPAEKPTVVRAPISYASPTDAAAKSVVADWLRKPGGADFSRVYPASAKANGIDGMVTLDCRLDAQGLLKQCTVAAEAPLEQGFGEAGLKLARSFQAKPIGKDGLPMGDRVRLPIRFVAPPPALASAVATVTQPVWIRKPMEEDFVRLYPADAVRQGLSGRVAMTCRIGPDGRLTECGIGPGDIQVANRPPSPADQDFGTATLQLAKLFQMEMKSRDGQDVAGGVIRIPVRWMPPRPAE